MDRVINIAKAVSDPGRARVLMCLRQAKELCACQIIEMLQLAPSTVSKHMSVLLEAGLVTTRRDHRWVYYRLADDDRARRAVAWLATELKDDPLVRADAERLTCVCKMDREELCKHYQRKV